MPKFPYLASMISRRYNLVSGGWRVALAAGEYVEGSDPQGFAYSLIRSILSEVRLTGIDFETRG